MRTSLARLLGRFPSPTPLRGRARGQRHLQRVSESGGGSLGQRAVPARWFCRALARRGSPAAASERALHPAGTAQERQCVRGTHAFACTIDTAGPVPQRGLCFPRRGAPAVRLCSPRLARFRRTGLPASAVPPLRHSGAAGGRAARGGKSRTESRCCPLWGRRCTPPPPPLPTLRLFGRVCRKRWGTRAAAGRGGARTRCAPGRRCRERRTAVLTRQLLRSARPSVQGQ